MATLPFETLAPAREKISLLSDRVPLIWLALVALGLIDSLWLFATPLRLSEGSQTQLLRLVPLVLIGIWGAPRLSRWPRLQMLCGGGVFLLVAWPVLRLYNHLTMTTAYPLADDWLAAADVMIRFDWLAYTTWLDRYPGLLAAMDFTYGGLTSYSILLFLFLSLGRDPVSRCRDLIMLFFITAVMCSTVGMFFPAMAAFTHFAPQTDLYQNIDPQVGAYHLGYLSALRTDPEHVLALHDLPGLVTFPSFHTAMGVIAIYCARGTPWLFGPSLVFNLLMIASTPLFGSHYLIDIVAGAAVAGSSIVALRWSNRRTAAPDGL